DHPSETGQLAGVVPKQESARCPTLLPFVAGLVVAALIAPAAAADGDIVERGAYLANAADCVSCHTDVEHGGQPYAGGRALATPFGTFYSPNITPDPETGIGRWNEAQFQRALRDG